ncbi:MAG: rod shape-determining protein RodA [Bacteroidales bacterium]|nr:rod shape-determining protein RodA [Bacteroidales bacterium]
MKSRFDKRLIVYYLILVFIGFLSVLSTSYKQGHFSFQTSYGYQLIWIATSIILAIVICVFNNRFFWHAAPWLYTFFTIMLVVVVLFGTERSGAKSWLGIGNFGIQPAEFAKYATCLFLARRLSDMHCDLSKKKSLIPILVIIGIPIGLILLQNDTGSALPLLFLVFALFREGLTPWILIIAVCAVVLFVLLVYLPQWIVFALVVLLFAWMMFRLRKRKKYHLGLIIVFIIVTTYIFTVDLVYNQVLKPHQKQRIELLFGKINDTKGIGYNVNQAKIAIGSGGFFGKGFGNGTQTKLNFVPEQVTDFIFCTIGEEGGFVGTTFVIVIFVLLIGRIISIAEKSQNAFVRSYGYCIASIFFAHVAINIGMTIGLMPVIGIPLPFISYGGSSLWAFTLMLFTFVMESRNDNWD